MKFYYAIAPAIIGVAITLVQPQFAVFNHLRFTQWVVYRWYLFGKIVTWNKFLN
ncbi:hypothetical protein [Nostoc sp. KVJ3]|uniref:hypothetical protein n=1 Tax=Nostoc sp. KVJ3 TaxID=457945 RepID=UPI0022380552|nr:hypothetical protein [Nostoc sp. KVJ3]